MRIPVEVAYLHSPHFHIAGATGKSLQDRLDARVPGCDLKIEWDTESKELCVTHGGREAHIPESNVKSYFPYVEEQKVKTLKPAATARAAERIKAQVSTPQDHVFAGPGGGKTK